MEIDERERKMLNGNDFALHASSKVPYSLVNAIYKIFFKRITTERKNSHKKKRKNLQIWLFNINKLELGTIGRKNLIKILISLSSYTQTHA